VEAIRKRRSVRKFTGEIIPREDLEKIVDAGRLACLRKQPPALGIHRRNRPRDDRSTYSGRQVDGKSRAIIAVVLDPYSRWWVEDGSAAIENMLIASTALGYGSCWVEGDSLPREEEFKTLLLVPKREKIARLDPDRGPGGMADH